MALGNDCQEGSRLRCASFMRFLTIGINVIMAIAAIAGFIIGLTMRDSIQTKLQSLCASCGVAFTVYLFFFGALLCVSFLGVFAICSGNILLRGMYFICLLFVFIAMLAICILYIIIMTSHLNLEGAWNYMVGKEDDKLCDIELELNCSGWKKLCGSQATSTTAEKCPKCSAKQWKEIDLFNETCETVISQNLKGFAKFVLLIGFTVLLVALIGMLATCLARRKKNRQQTP